MAPAYNLFLSKSVYVKLLQLAEQRGLSLGKLINVVLQNFVEQPEDASAPRCLLCGAEPAAKLEVNASRTLFFCQQHAQTLPRLLKKLQPLS